MPSSEGEGVGAASAATDCKSNTEPTPMAKSRRPNNSILPTCAETSSHSAAVPAHVSRQPAPQLETTLARGTVAPRGRDLGDAHAKQVRLHSQLDAELEASVRFDRHLVEQPPGVHAEVAGGVVNRDACRPVQGKARSARHGSL